MKSLMECKKIDQVVRLQRDHFNWKDFSLLSDGYTVYLGEQKIGEPPTQSFHIPKTVFDRLLRRYMKQQRENAR